jgi:heme/copper-type cytochrome/quinol oxidase subunit 2
MSVADLLKGNFIDGGPLFMTLVYIMWVLVIIITIKFLRNHRSKDRDLKKLEKLNSTILFIGAFVFLFSLFYRSLGIYGALSTIIDAQDISPSILANGLRMSYIAPLYSFFLFLVTSLIWFLFRNKIKD